MSDGDLHNEGLSDDPPRVASPAPKNATGSHTADRLRRTEGGVGHARTGAPPTNGTHRDLQRASVRPGIATDPASGGHINGAANVHRPARDDEVFQTAPGCTAPPMSMDGSGDPDVLSAVVTIERLSHLMRSAEHASGLKPVHWDVLRYLARCNRFSNAPSAVARYLGTSKGTISQTINVLCARGLVEKTARNGERRSVALYLTREGWEILGDDPWQRLLDNRPGWRDVLRGPLGEVLAGLLDEALRERARATFGTCASCVHFDASEQGSALVEGVSEAATCDDQRPMAGRCSRFRTPVSGSDASRMCCAHSSLGARGER